jgi:hypothetical protein
MAEHGTVYGMDGKPFSGSGPVDGPPGPPHDNDMETRVAKLEAGVGEIKAILVEKVVPILSAIESRLASLEAGEKIVEGRLQVIETKVSALPSGESFGEIKGRVASIPSLFQIGAVMLGINAGIVAVAGLIIVLLKS